MILRSDTAPPELQFCENVPVALTNGTGGPSISDRATSAARMAACRSSQAWRLTATEPMPAPGPAGSSSRTEFDVARFEGRDSPGDGALSNVGIDRNGVQRSVANCGCALWPLNGFHTNSLSGDSRCHSASTDGCALTLSQPRTAANRLAGGVPWADACPTTFRLTTSHLLTGGSHHGISREASVAQTGRRSSYVRAVSAR